MVYTMYVCYAVRVVLMGSRTVCAVVDTWYNIVMRECVVCGVVCV